MDIFAYNSDFPRKPALSARLQVKFAFVIFKYFPFGGAQRDMMRIVQQCLRLGHQVHVFTLSWEGPPPETGMTIEILHAQGWSNHRRYQNFARQIHARLATSRFDLVVGFNRIPGLDVYFAADPCFIERAHTQRGRLYRLSGRFRFFSDCEKAVFSASGRCEILLLSPNEKLVFQHWYHTPEARFHLLPPSIQAERFTPGDTIQIRAEVREEFGFGFDDQLMLLIGSGFKTKGLDRAILALAALPEEMRKRTRLLAVGQDNPRFFQKMASQLGLAANVRVSAGRNDIPRLMQAADLLVHPAYRENTGLVLLEACASGLPVLASDVCGYAFHIEKAGAGQLATSPFDQNAFNRQMQEMLTSPERPVWRAHGLRYAQGIIDASKHPVEADLLLRFALAKQETSS